MKIINIEKELIPYSFSVELSGLLFKFTVKYNTTKDFFTVDLTQGTQEIVCGEKLIYGRTLFDTKQHLLLPVEAIVPFSYDPSIQNITYENMGDEVFLLVVEAEDVI